MAPWLPTWKYLGFVVYVILYLVLCQSLWNYPPQTPKSAIFKVLPLFHLLFVIFSTEVPKDDDGYSIYRLRIVCGLLCSMVGDAMLVWRVKLFIPGMLAFGVAHACYIRAFGFRPIGGAPTVTSCLIVVVTTKLIVLPLINEGFLMRVLVSGYIILINAMTWRAVVCYLSWPSRGSFCACAGAILFLLSDFLLAIDKWHHPIEGAALYVHLIYFIAQLLISTSAVCYESRQLVKHD